MESSHHILEHFFLCLSEGGDNWLHCTGLQVWNTEDVLQEHVGVNEARPREQMDETLLVVGHIIKPLLNSLVVDRAN